MILAALAVAALDVALVDANPTSIDVSAAVQCKGSSDDLFTLLVMRSNDPAYATKRSWKGIEKPNGFFPKRYRLPRPIEVFGRKSNELTFTNNSVFAVLSGVDVRTLATELNIKPDIDDGETFMGGRVARKELHLDPEDDTRTRVMLALQVSTMGEPAGNVLIGCSYSSEVVK